MQFFSECMLDMQLWNIKFQTCVLTSGHGGVVSCGHAYSFRTWSGNMWTCILLQDMQDKHASKVETWGLKSNAWRSSGRQLYHQWWACVATVTAWQPQWMSRHSWRQRTPTSMQDMRVEDINQWQTAVQSNGVTACGSCKQRTYFNDQHAVRGCHDLVHLEWLLYPARATTSSSLSVKH